MRTVVAALIESDGKLLVCQRRRDAAFALKWEFPGGKAEPGETPEQALERELREELGVAARVGPEVHRTRHKYAEMPDAIELRFYACSITTGELKNLDFEQIVWREPQALQAMDFLAADRELIAMLAEGSLRFPTP
ncbi:MAG TPA: (deoxy)nucleoside triphosphate pyrophosphohydrolase [Candidatus Acidoferrales bacterium]|nr:(deoxy)nucleoside triphosphate pyrophosphohydrolase [Candidatus Acidoferrales bacterium]